MLLHHMKHRRAISFASCAAAAFLTHGAASSVTSSPDLDTATFAAFNRVCGASAALWGASSCGPLMIIDSDTRRAVANQADAAGILKPIAEGLFAGTLAADVMLSNTATDVGGTHWAMVLLPLPDGAAERDVLLAHEAFHRVQPTIGIASAETEGRNGHLDREHGRLWLQLEARALDRALIALAGGTDPRPAVRDALAFRAERRRLFSTAAVDENALERIEGTAEYTGIMAATDKLPARIGLARQDLSRLTSFPSFTRAFAYATGPAYGLLLDAVAGPSWRKQYVAGVNFDVLLAAAAGGSAISPTLSIRANRYDAPTLAKAEHDRELDRIRRDADLRASLVDGPVLVIPIGSQGISFDPRSVVVLDGVGTVYRRVKTAGAWGQLDASGPALVVPDWSAVRVPGPVKIGGQTISGQGWELTLAAGWAIVPGAKAGQQRVSKADPPIR